VVIEDVVTTGLSTKEVIAVAHASEGEVVAVGSIIDRTGGHAGFDVPFASLITLDVPTMKPEDCTLCRAGIPVVKPGSRKK
jgi:orotate phosphoribosyltransferase